MARQKEFNRTVALQKAMEIFWQQGYAATSMQDLVDGMGIGRGSLYDTFGSKQQLYHEALAHYQNTCGQSAFEPLAQPDAGAAQVVQVFQNIADEALTESPRRGCFVVQSAVEHARCDAQIVERFELSLDHMEQLFVRALQNAQATGDFAADQLPRATAYVLINHVLGMRTLDRAGVKRKIVQHVVDSVRTLFR